jgi:large conductance mechanosensitive channel
MAGENKETSMRPRVQGFIDFVKEQGVVGLAIGFILGGSVTVVVKSLVDDILNPLIGLLLGRAKDFNAYAIHVGNASINWGRFANNLLNFIIIALVVYAGFKILKLDRLQKEKK